MMAGRQIGNLVEVALNYHDAPGTAWHEALHFLKRVGAFTPLEWRLLESRARDEWMGRYGQRDPEESDRLRWHSKVIAACSRPASSATSSRASASSVTRLANFLRGRGFQTVEDGFARVASGEVEQRPSHRDYLATTTLAHVTGKERLAGNCRPAFQVVVRLVAPPSEGVRAA